MRPLPRTLNRLPNVVKRVDEIRKALASPAAPPVSSTTSENVMAEKKLKKAVKKVAAKASKAPAKKTAADTGDKVTLADLAEAAGISPQRARQKLREAELEKDGRWVWEKGDKQIKEVEKILAGSAE